MSPAPATPEPTTAAPGTDPDRAGRPILTARSIEKRFGRLVVLDGVNLELPRGAAVGIVGPNGAGKTTLLEILAGSQQPNSGRVEFAGSDVTGLGAIERSRLGIARTHQVPRPFGDMTVFENVYVGATAGGGLRGGRAYERCLDSLELAGLLALGNRPANSLGLMHRKRLELARALATGPTLLLLDEIGGGLTDAEADEFLETVGRVRARGVTLVWIEHVVHVLVRAVERLVCLAAGRVIADGAPPEVLADPVVMDAYLGREAT